MNEERQKQFQLARKRFADAKQALLKLGSAVQPAMRALSPSVEWYTIEVAGKSRRYSTSENAERFDPSNWPTGKEIAAAWVECDEAFDELAQAYKRLSLEDRDYVGAEEPKA